MTTRLSEKMLFEAVKDLAGALGVPYNEWRKVGSISVVGSYGGWQLQRIVMADSGTMLPMTTGFIPKRELYYKVRDMLAGIYMENARARNVRNQEAIQ